MVVYRGITMGASPKNSEDMQRIKSWNMNCVLQEYFIDSLNIPQMRQQRDLASQFGLKTIIGLRVAHHEADVCARHDYVNMTTEGRSYFADIVRTIAQNFPNSIICPWFMPYHGCIEWSALGTVTEERCRAWYFDTFPALLNAIRQYNSQPVIFVPIHQGFVANAGMGEGGGHCQTGWYREDAPYGLTVEKSWYSDPNIIFNIDTHGSYNYEVQGKNWDYDTAYHDYNFSGAFNFKRKYPNAKLFSVEYSNLKIYNVSIPDPPVDPYNIDPSRLAWVERNCQKMQELNAGWTYYGYSQNCTWDTPQLPDGSNSALAEILKKYAGLSPVVEAGFPMEAVLALLILVLAGIVISRRE